MILLKVKIKVICTESKNTFQKIKDKVYTVQASKNKKLNQNFILMNKTKMMNYTLTMVLTNCNFLALRHKNNKKFSKTLLVKILRFKQKNKILMTLVILLILEILGLQIIKRIQKMFSKILNSNKKEQIFGGVDLRIPVLLLIKKLSRPSKNKLLLFKNKNKLI